MQITIELAAMRTPTPRMQDLPSTVKMRRSRCAPHAKLVRHRCIWPTRPAPIETPPKPLLATERNRNATTSCGEYGAIRTHAHTNTHLAASQVDKRCGRASVQHQNPRAHESHKTSTPNAHLQNQSLSRALAQRTTAYHKQNLTCAACARTSEVLTWPQLGRDNLSISRAFGEGGRWLWNCLPPSQAWLANVPAPEIKPSDCELICQIGQLFR